MRVSPPSPTADQVVVRKEVRAVVRLLDDLKPADAEILRLAAWEELDIAEIAIVLDNSPEAASQRLSRARKRLNDMYEDQYEKKETSSPTPLLRKEVCGERRTPSDGIARGGQPGDRNRRGCLDGSSRCHLPRHSRAKEQRHDPIGNPEERTGEQATLDHTMAARAATAVLVLGVAAIVVNQTGEQGIPLAGADGDPQATEAFQAVEAAYNTFNTGDQEWLDLRLRGSFFESQEERDALLAELCDVLAETSWLGNLTSRSPGVCPKGTANGATASTRESPRPLATTSSAIPP